MELFRKLREKPRGMRFFSPPPQASALVWVSANGNKQRSGFPSSDQRMPGDGTEAARLMVQAVQFYEKKLRDFYTVLRYFTDFHM